MKYSKYKKLMQFTFLLILTLSLNRIYPQSVPQLLPGFPKLIDPILQPTSLHKTPLTADFNSDGYKEILISTGYGNNEFTRLYLINHNGNIVNNWPKEFPQARASAFAAGDVNGDGFIDAVLKTEDSLYVFNYDGSLHNRFPVATDFNNPLEPMVLVSLYDFDNDGKLEIVTNKNNNELFVFNYDGTIKNGWPKIIDDTRIGPVSIGDLNNDDIAEIILPSRGTSSPKLNGFSINGDTLPGWPIDLGTFSFGHVMSAVVFKDIDHDSSYILFNPRYKTPNNNYIIRVSTYNYKGKLIRRYSVPSYRPNHGISLGDFNGDGILEHTFGNEYDSSFLYTRDGNLLGKFYKCRAKYHHTLAIGKLTNEMNIISSTALAIWDTGYVYGYYPNGNPLEWSPLRFYGSASGSVTFSDINNDGQVDMVVSVKGLSASSYMGTYIYVWTFPGVTFSYDNFPWPMYGHDRYRTFQHGFIPPDEPVGINTISNNIPDKFYLYQNYPNPFNPSTSIRFDVPSSSFVKITIYNILGKEVTTLINEELSSGSYEVEWPAPTGDGMDYPSGVYFYKLTANDFVDVKKMVLVK